MLEDVRPPGEQPAARLGETIDLVGHNLSGTGRQVLLVNDRFEVEESLPASGSSEAARMQFSIPVARAADFPVGTYRVWAEVLRPGESDPRQTNHLALVLAPEITDLPMDAARDGSGTASFSLGFRPELRPGQTVSLLLGQQEIDPESYSAPTGTLNFEIADALVGDHLARLRIDGIDSPIINRAVMPPEFFDNRINII